MVRVLSHGPFLPLSEHRVTRVYANERLQLSSWRFCLRVRKAYLEPCGSPERMKMLRAVFFDFDGLILDTEYPEFLSWKEVFEAHGCCLPLQTWAEHIGTGTQNNPFSPYDLLDTLLGRRLDRDTLRTMRRKR